MAAQKPLAVRMLEQRKIRHEVFEFDDSIRSAQEVARVAGVPEEQVLKTLVVEQDPPRGKPFLVMMPASLEIDLKVLAASLGLKKRPHGDVTATPNAYTGLKVGGISALALLGKGFPVLIEESAMLFDEVLVSAGQRGLGCAAARFRPGRPDAVRNLSGPSRRRIRGRERGDVRFVGEHDDDVALVEQRVRARADRRARRRGAECPGVTRCCVPARRPATDFPARPFCAVASNSASTSSPWRPLARVSMKSAASGCKAASTIRRPPML